ncbi:hypothetical protein GCM10010232_26780 [Streptomyces amakusaensis]|uniref:YncE family protein n=1 Tax=Streptomyces amakusaensis TaxID=67271 RepID=A0ABW0ADP6_9ACTN
MTATATALAVLFSSAALVAGTAGTAAADSARVLPVKSVVDVVVDSVHRRVFVSDPFSGKIVATDYAGKVVATVGNLPGVQGLALSGDSRQLYAAVPGDDSIVSVETRSVTQTARYPIGEGTDPQHLAVVGDKIWFGYAGDIGLLDLSGAEPVVTLGRQHADSTMDGPPLLKIAPGAPDTLVAVDTRSVSGVLETYAVAGDTLTRTALGKSGSSTDDAEITPDGGKLVTATGGNALLAWNTSDLTQSGRYTSSYGANSVAIAPGGTLAVGAFAWYDPDVFVYRPGSAASVRQYDFPNTGGHSGGDTLVPGGLAWDTSAGRLFAVSVNSGNAFSLRTMDDPVKALPRLTVDAPAKATRGKSLKVSGKLTATLAFPAGTEVSVVRTDAESPKGKSLGKKKVAGNGSYSFNDTPHSGGKVTYKVSYAGGKDHAGASASDKVDVSRSRATLSLDKNNKIYNYDNTVNFTAKLGKTYKNRTVKLYADPAGDGKGRKLVKTGKVNGSGTISVKVKLTRDTTVTAVYDGDSRTSSASAKTWVGTRAKVSTTVVGHYKTGKLGGQTYYHFKKSKEPRFDTRMNHYQGRQQRMTVEYQYRGDWYSMGDMYFALDRAGLSKVWYTVERTVGERLRMRSAYINGSSGDTVNSTAYGSWKYFTFTR